MPNMLALFTFCEKLITFSTFLKNSSQNMINQMIFSKYPPPQRNARVFYHQAIRPSPETMGSGNNSAPITNRRER
jgi:hypothetical protein